MSVLFVPQQDRNKNLVDWHVSFLEFLLCTMECSWKLSTITFILASDMYKITSFHQMLLKSIRQGFMLLWIKGPRAPGGHKVKSQQSTFAAKKASSLHLSRASSEGNLSFLSTRKTWTYWNKSSEQLWW